MVPAVPLAEGNMVEGGNKVSMFRENEEDFDYQPEPEPVTCPITEREDCKYARVSRSKEEWGWETDFECHHKADKDWPDDKCPLEWNRCKKCKELVNEDDTVWIDLITKGSSSPNLPNSAPYHVGCAPSQYDNEEDTDEDEEEG